MQPRLPDFLIIGAQKCGTTWLHHQLATHPDIFLPEKKDHEFFSYTHNPDKQQINTWSERYQAASEQQIIGDATASYFWSALPEPWHVQPDRFNPDIPTTVKQTLGEKTQFIVMLRDPAERAVSAYLHHVGMGALSLSDSIFSAPDKLGILHIGFYGRHLANWLEHFSKDLIYVEQRPIKSHHQDILKDVCRFLNVDSHDFENSGEVVYRGIQRVQNEEGVWLPLQRIKDISSIDRALPITVIDGVYYLRVVHPAELDRLDQLFAQDQELLATLLSG